MKARRNGDERYDARFMRRAAALARRGEGLTRPNPPVGAVLVRGGRIIGEGWHHAAGLPHAEAEAIAAAGSGGKARGATLYVTLEPCSTAGRQPPCADAIVRAGIRRVFCGAADPNPENAGGAAPVLAAAGIPLAMAQEAGGVREAAECEALIEGFRSAQLRGRPYVLLKLGISMDGRTADAEGASKWITGEVSRRRVQALRRAADAVMVGAGTVRADNPSLLPRPARGREPWRVVVAGQGTLPEEAQLFTDAAAERTIVAARAGWHPGLARRLAVQGVQIWEFTEKTEDFLPAVLRRLAAECGAMRVLCEGGGGLAGALLKGGLADEIRLFAAPVVLGGPGGMAGGACWPVAAPARFRLAGPPRRSGADLELRYLPA
jgi:diaminohydroxyphosphoribosylaminopyrimidine deaminase/5-amino-6-(5-phosphoribosylamino)uracil reductase